MSDSKSGYSISVLIKNGKTFAELRRRRPWYVHLWWWIQDRLR